MNKKLLAVTVLCGAMGIASATPLPFVQGLNSATIGTVTTVIQGADPSATLTTEVSAVAGEWIDGQCQKTVNFPDIAQQTIYNQPPNNVLTFTNDRLKLFRSAAKILGGLDNMTCLSLTFDKKVISEPEVWVLTWNGSDYTAADPTDSTITFAKP